MPFGLDFKSVIVGFLFAYFVLPWLLSLYYRSRRAASPTTA